MTFQAAILHASMIFRTAGSFSQRLVEPQKKLSARGSRLESVKEAAFVGHLQLLVCVECGRVSITSR